MAGGTHSEGAMMDAQLRSAAILNEVAGRCRQRQNPEDPNREVLDWFPTTVCNASKTASSAERFANGRHRG